CWTSCGQLSERWQRATTNAAPSIRGGGAEGFAAAAAGAGINIGAGMCGALGTAAIEGPDGAGGRAGAGLAAAWASLRFALRLEDIAILAAGGGASGSASAC